LVPFDTAQVERGFSDPSLPSELRVSRDPFDTGFSIWYLVTDIVELVKIYKNIFRPLDLSKRYRQSQRLQRLRETLTGREKETASQLHNSNLFIHFGLLPTVADFQAFFTLCKKWTDRYDQAKELFRKKHLYHLPAVDAPFLNLFDRTFHSAAYAPEATFDIRVELSTLVKARFHRTLQYQYTAPEFQGWLSRLRQFVDAFGILDPSAIWDIVPFSFVLDWFIQVGKWMHNNRPRLFAADIKVLDYCESIKRVDVANWYLSYYAMKFNAVGEAFNPPYEPHTERFVWRETYTNYVRREFSPSVKNFHYTPLPGKPKCFVNLGRISIASSLLAQRLPR
jgi:hypothetical protein